MKCPTGGGDVKAQDQKIAAFGSSYTGRAAFLQTKKKALQSKTFLNFGAPRETRTPTSCENGF